MKKKKRTFNVRSTPPMEWAVNGLRLKEDPAVYRDRNKKIATPNAQRSTSIIERAHADGRVAEDSRDSGISNKKDSTFNAQRSTPNAQRLKNARFDLEERLLEFSARIIRLVDALPNTRAANHVAGQLLRCGTSPYGNHGEVDAAESRKDFIHKLKICLKELKESRRWLRLVKKAGMLPEPKMAPILHETEELIMIFFASIRTAEENAK
jgi:four helix bundle protein